MQEDLITKVKGDIREVECCNTCLGGERESNSDGDYPMGIKCLEGVPNEGKFDSLCGLYRKDVVFIEYNKRLSENGS